MIKFLRPPCLRSGPLLSWQWCLFYLSVLLGIQLPIESSADEKKTAFTDSSLGAHVRNSLPVASDGMFLTAKDGQAIWEKTIKTVAADWPVIKTIPPDFDSLPPRAGRIESAWVQLPQSLKKQGDQTGGLSTSWPHLPRQRQRVVVQVLPAVNGAWVDAVVETQPLASNDASLMSERVVLTGGPPFPVVSVSCKSLVLPRSRRLPRASSPGLWRQSSRSSPHPRPSGSRTARSQETDQGSVAS